MEQMSCVKKCNKHVEMRRGACAHVSEQRRLTRPPSSSRVLTRVPHMATTAGDEATVQYMLKRWQDRDTGLDAAWREDYTVYLSFPNKDKPNNVTVGESLQNAQLLSKPSHELISFL